MVLPLLSVWGWAPQSCVRLLWSVFAPSPRRVEWLYTAFKLVGRLYLLHLAWSLRRGAAAPLVTPASVGPRPTAGLIRSFLLALATQLSNPKTVLVISGIFAALLPSHVPAWMYLAIPPIDFVLEGSWYAFVAVAMSSTAPRMFYTRARSGIDRTPGCVLGVLRRSFGMGGAQETSCS
jgi:threonine/homoserine/homoserine lactone efflux protein